MNIRKQAAENQDVQEYTTGIQRSSQHCGISIFTSVQQSLQLVRSQLQPSLTQCVACPANSHSEEGSGHITKCVCNIGWLGYDGGPCEQCPLGKYTVFISNWEAECSNCPAGQYSPVLGIGITSCQNCMKGTYSTADAAICTSCPTNSDSFETSTVQSACICNAGSTGSDGETCSECARGKFKLYNGSAACEECPPETFQARSGATHCTQCRANSYSLQGSIAALSCAPAMLATVR